MGSVLTRLYLAGGMVKRRHLSWAAPLFLVPALLVLPPPAAAGTRTHIVSGNGGVSDDPTFPASWDHFSATVHSCRIDRDAPDAVYTSDEGFQYFYGLIPFRRAGLLYFDVSSVPHGRRVKRAVLHMKTWWVGMAPDPNRPDSLFACADTSASDARWVGSNSATFSEPREGESGPWTPALSARMNYRQFGIVSRPWRSSVPAGQNSPGQGWWSLDVTRGVQAWVNGRPNAGFWVFGRAWYDKSASMYWSQAANPTLRPWLEIVWEDVPYCGPWPGGREVAFSFSTDDGFRSDNLAWASALDSLGHHFTIAVVDSFIEASQPGTPGTKLNDTELAQLAAAGHEIAGHSTSHREWNPLVVPDSVVAWGVEQDSISRHVGPNYQVRSIAWPFHLHNRRMMEIARDEGYIVGRNGGLDWATLKRGQLCSWDSCRIYEVGLTMADANITGDEAATRAYVRNSIREGIEHGNCWINLYTHTTDGRYSGGAGISRQELVWVIDELERSGTVWIETLGNVAAYYRQYHVPSLQDPLLLILDPSRQPIATDDAAAVAEDSLVSIPVLANDQTAVCGVDPATVAITVHPVHGSADIDPLTGAVVYMPAADYNGTDSLQYDFADTCGLRSGWATVTITVLPRNDPPVAAADTLYCAGPDSVAILVLANDHDIDGALSPETLTIVVPPVQGEAVVDALRGCIVYRPPMPFASADSLCYVVRDDSLALSNPAWVCLKPGGGPPGAVSGLQARIGWRRVELTWGEPIGIAVAYEIYRSEWRQPGGLVAYPLFDDLPGAVLPEAPASRAAAASDTLWTLIATVPAGIRAHSDSVSARNVYEYVVFAQGPNGEFGPPPAAPTRARNYILGDFEPEEDGAATAADLALLGAQYGGTRADPGFAPELDIGPTDDGGPLGLPLTDGRIDFEDLMILARSFEGTELPPPGGEPEPARIGWAWLDEHTVALLLLDPCPQLKGLRVRVPLLPGEPPAVSVTAPAAGAAGPVAAMSAAGGGLDLGIAVLGEGRTFLGTGEVCRLVFSAPVPPLVPVVDGRTRENAPLLCQLVQSTGAPGAIIVRLDQNSPNPFNPRTKITFTLPCRTQVRLDVFDLAGRRVATPLQGDLPPGLHEAVWDGRDGEGRGVPSGPYLYRLSWAGEHLTRRMLLLK